jgi:ABC-type transport system involved in multi-copper enzyme maturation permease subunit
MIRHVIEKELKDCLYGYRSLLLFILSTVLFTVSIYLETRGYQNDLKEYRLAQVSLRQSMGEETTFFALATYAFNFVKPPPVLGILVRGVESHTPRVYSLRLFALPTPQGGAVSENPTVAIFGALDVAYIVQVILGMAALLFTFSAVCGEKEMGTLKLQLANPLPKDVLLLGKLVGNLVGLLAPVALAFLLGCLLLMNFDGVSLGKDELLRALLIGLDFVLYLTVVFCLGICVSTLANRMTTAFALCLTIWVFLVAIVPKAAVITANRISPLESLNEFEMKKADVDRRGSVRFEEEVRKYGREHNGQSMPRYLYEDLLRRVREEQNRELKKIEEDYLQRKERQARVALMFSRLSPAGSASYAAMSLARTGLERDFRFRTALRDYRSLFTVYYDRKADEQLALSGREPINSVLVKQVFSDIPPFEFHEEPLAASVDRALPDMGLLAVWALGFFLIAYFAFLRYDVR